MRERSLRQNWSLIRRRPVHIALALVAVAAIVGIEHLLGQGTLAWALPLPLALLAGEVIMRDAIRRDEKRDPPA